MRQIVKDRQKSLQLKNYGRLIQSPVIYACRDCLARSRLTAIPRFDGAFQALSNPLQPLPADRSLGFTPHSESLKLLRLALNGTAHTCRKFCFMQVATQLMQTKIF